MMIIEGIVFIVAIVVLIGFIPYVKKTDIR